MEGYIVAGLMLNFAVNIMLLMAASRVTGYCCSIVSALSGGLISLVYAAVCLIPRFQFLGNRFWYAVSLCLVSMTAFGLDRSAFRKGAAYGLFRLALNGLTDGTDHYFDLIWAGSLSLVCLFGFRGGMWRQYVPVVLRYGQQTVSLTALCDTGNTLRDPITGRSVLVVGADVANRLTGLTSLQLSQPLLTLGQLPGLRLIPYKTVQSTGSFMLALLLKNACVGDRKEDVLVAFAPVKLDESGVYQALIGGTV